MRKSFVAILVLAAALGGCSTQDQLRAKEYVFDPVVSTVSKSVSVNQQSN